MIVKKRKQPDLQGFVFQSSCHSLHHDAVNKLHLIILAKHLYEFTKG